VCVAFKLQQQLRQQQQQQQQRFMQGFKEEGPT
jgi:hypothetical protein